MEFSLVSLYSSEIIHYRSLFLKYKLTRVNSVREGNHDGFSMSYIVNAMSYDGLATQGTRTSAAISISDPVFPEYSSLSP